MMRGIKEKDFEQPMTTTETSGIHLVRVSDMSTQNELIAFTKFAYICLRLILQKQTVRISV